MTRGEFENKILPVSQNLYRFAYRLLSSREEAEDAVQEVFVKLWNMRHKLSEYRSTEALAMTMTRNHCLDMLRRKSREITVDREAPDHGDNGVNPEQIFEKEETYNRVLAIVNTLPEQYRIAVLMRDVDGMEYEDIAKDLGVNVNTLRVNLSRGRKMVKEQLMKLNYEPARS